MTALLKVENLRKSFGGVVATNDLSLDVRQGELHAIIGPNGAGKTTLISQLSGQLRPTSGRILYEGADVSRLPMAKRARAGIIRSFQITSLCREFTVLANVVLAVQARAGHSFRFISDPMRNKRLTGPALAALERVGLADRANFLAGHLAHGEQRQLELAVALAAGPKVLLLDEPMAGMGTEESGKVVDLLLSLKREYTIMLVEHDMDAVFALADRISVLVYGQAIASGPPEMIRNDAAVRAAYLGEEGPGA